MYLAGGRRGGDVGRDVWGDGELGYLPYTYYRTVHTAPHFIPRYRFVNPSLSLHSFISLLHVQRGALDRCQHDGLGRHGAGEAKVTELHVRRGGVEGKEKKGSREGESKVG